MTDLDDFFAKKDKRKCGSKSEGSRPLTKPPGIKSITPVQIGRKLLEDCDVTRKNRCDSRGAEEEDDEWKPYDAEEKKDYSGLKIQALVLPETDEADPETADEHRKQPNGPWKIADVPSPHTEEPSDGAYVNPIQRVIGKSQITAAHAAPDVKSNIVFPTLSEGLKVGTNQDCSNKGRASRAEQNREATKPVEIASRVISRNGLRNSNTDTEGKHWEMLRNGPRNAKLGNISRNGLRNGRNTINTKTNQGEISRILSRNDPCNIIEPEFEQTEISRVISRNGTRNTETNQGEMSRILSRYDPCNNIEPEFEQREISRNSPRNGVDTEFKEGQISRTDPRNVHTTDPILRNGSWNTASIIGDAVPNPTRLNRIPTNRLNTPKTNVGRNERENLNPSSAPEGKFIECQNEATIRVGKYLPPGLRQKFSVQTGSTLG
uniref:Uncharacterized protein n=1 Tax=Cacopsylla melanoneura TaxID=428564 RepID=A0A8D8SL71_9HEMI